MNRVSPVLIMCPIHHSEAFASTKWQSSKDSDKGPMGQNPMVLGYLSLESHRHAQPKIDIDCYIPGSQKTLVLKPGSISRIGLSYHFSQYPTC